MRTERFPATWMIIIAAMLTVWAAFIGLTAWVITAALLTATAAVVSLVAGSARARNRAAS